MEVIIAMVIGLFAGAYLRKPFALIRRAEREQVREQPAGEGEKRRPGEASIEDELKNMVNYTGKRGEM